MNTTHLGLFPILIALAAPKVTADMATDPFWAATPPDDASPAATGAPLELAQLDRRRPGGVPREEKKVPDRPQPDLNRGSGLSRISPPQDMNQPGDFIPVPDRWRLAKDLGVVKESYIDPYNRNILKADRPFYKDWFFSASVISDFTFEQRRLPTMVAPQSPLTGGRLEIFGNRRQELWNENLILALVAFQGDTTFRPPDYEFRLTLVPNVNYSRAQENRVLHIDPSDGKTRWDNHVGVQELFVDKHLRNVSDRYDFDSLRIGIQPFSTDFRGFLFQDLQMGVRLFGNRDNNLWQYNLAWFRRYEKDTNSGLNDTGEGLRDDDVWIANLYRQDWPVLGFFSQGTVVFNKNKEDNRTFFDSNGFIQRPASLGQERNRGYEVTYLGYNGDGHFGRLNLTTSLYYAHGNESRAVFVDNDSNIRAFFGAAEASMDFDWIRPRLSFLYQSGDDDPFDDESNGFDAINENPIFAGFDTSFWIRQAIPLIGGGGVALSTRNGVLANLRSSKEHGQSNFTNPGLWLFGVGSDFDITPQFRLSLNANKLKFDHTEVLEAARNQARIDKDIGWDLSVASIYRPFMTQNIVLRLSYAMLLPGDGYKDLFGDNRPYSIFANFVFTY